MATPLDMPIQLAASPYISSVTISWAAVENASSYRIETHLSATSVSNGGGGTVNSIGGAMGGGAMGGGAIGTGAMTGGATAGGTTSSSGTTTNTGTTHTSTAPIAPVTTTTTSGTVTGLAPGAAYTFSVIACPVPASADYTESLPATIDSRPGYKLLVGQFIGSHFSDNSVLFTWAPVDNASGYRIEELSGTIQPVTIPLNVSLDQYTYRLYGLQSGVSYAFRLTALRSEATIDISTDSHAVIIPATNSTIAPFTRTTGTFRTFSSSETISTGFKDLSTNTVVTTDTEPIITFRQQIGYDLALVTLSYELNGTYIIARNVNPGSYYEVSARFADRAPVIKRMFTPSHTIYEPNAYADVTFDTISSDENATRVTVGYTVSSAFIAKRSLASDNLRFWRLRVRWYNSNGAFVSGSLRYLRTGDNIANSFTISAPNINPGHYTFTVRLESPDGVVGPEVSPILPGAIAVGIPKVTDISLSGGSLVTTVVGPVTSYEWSKSTVLPTYTIIAGESSSSLNIASGYSNGDIIKVTPKNGSIDGESHTYVIGGDGPVAALSKSQVAATVDGMTQADKLDILDKLPTATLEGVDMTGLTAAQASKLTSGNAAALTPAQWKQMPADAVQTAPVDALSAAILKELLTDPEISLSPSQLLTLSAGSLADAAANASPAEQSAMASSFTDAAKGMVAGSTASQLSNEDFAKVKIFVKTASEISENVESFELNTTSDQMNVTKLKSGTRAVVVVPAASVGAGEPAKVTVETAINCYIMTEPDGAGVQLKNKTGGVIATISQNSDGQFVVNDEVLTDEFHFKVVNDVVTAFLKGSSGYTLGVNAPLVTVNDVTSSSVKLDVQLNQDFNLTGATLRIDAIINGNTQTFTYTIGAQYTGVQTFLENTMPSSMIIPISVSEGNECSFRATIIGSGSTNSPTSVSTPKVVAGGIFFAQPPTITVTGGAGAITLSNISFSPFAYYQLDVLKSDFTRYSDVIYIGGPSTTFTKYLPAGDYAVLISPIISDTGYVNGLADLQSVTVTAVAPVCFLADAPVLTPRGYRPIREFRVGDTVLTADGREVAISRVFSRRYGPSAATNPYVIPKGFLGATRPVAISPDHEVLVPGRGMIRARDLGLRRMKMGEEFVYYNLELEDWVRDNLVVAGVTVESLAPATRITMTKAEFTRFVMERYPPSALARLRTVCFDEKDGNVSMPALR